MRRVFACVDCGKGPNCPMIRDEIWNSIASRRTLLCIHCAEARLGRSIELADLTSCLGNDWGVIIAKRSCPQLDVSSYEGFYRVERAIP